MARKCKCQICKKQLNTDIAYKIIKNKYLFIITSGIFFGFLHIFPTDLNIVYALINSIPYVTMGMVLAYIYIKEDNIYR